MGYINGLRSFGHRSQLAAARSISKKSESTDKWINALARAEQAHCVTEKMSDHSCYLRDSSIYVHGTVATPPPDLCGTWKVLAWSPDQIWYLVSVTHWLCRKAAELAREERFKEAEETAIRGINELKERSVSNSVFFIGYLVTDEFHDSVSLAPDVMYSGISELWDEEIVDRM